MSDDDEKEPIAVIRASEIGPEPSKSMFPDYLAELQRMTGDAEIGGRWIDPGPIILGVDVAREPDVISFAVGRRWRDDTIEFIDARRITAIDGIWKDEARDIPEWIWKELGERRRRILDDIVREIIMGPVPSRMSDHVRILEDVPVLGWEPKEPGWPKWSDDIRPLFVPLRKPRMGFDPFEGTTTTTQLPVERPPLRPALAPDDIERLRLAEEKRKRKAAKRKGRL